jgi:dihydroorotase
MIYEDGRYKMNPPIRGEADRHALVDGIIDGTIDMIATDHAPHSEEEKSRGLEHSAFGIVGLETAFPLIYTFYVKTGIISLERALELMVYNPRERFGLPLEPDGFSIWDVSKEKKVDPEEFLSMGRATPVKGWSLYGENLLTVHRGKVVYKK